MTSSSISGPQSTAVPAVAAATDAAQAQQRQARVEQHLDRVAEIAIRSGYTGPKNAALIQFVEARFLEAELERRSLHQVQSALRAAGVLPEPLAGADSLVPPSTLAEGLRILSGRLAAQQATIEELTSRSLGALHQPGSETSTLAQALAARAAAAVTTPITSAAHPSARP